MPHQGQCVLISSLFSCLDLVNTSSVYPYSTLQGMFWHASLAHMHRVCFDWWLWVAFRHLNWVKRGLPLRRAAPCMQEGFLAEDDFGAQDDYQRELDEEAEFEQQRLDAERRNAAENVAGITLLQEGTNKLPLSSLDFHILLQFSCMVVSEEDSHV